MAIPVNTSQLTNETEQALLQHAEQLSSLVLRQIDAGWYGTTQTIAYADAAVEHWNELVERMEAGTLEIPADSGWWYELQTASKYLRRARVSSGLYGDNVDANTVV